MISPADVRGAKFAKPPVGKRGYNEDEVDSFLDTVEATLTELYRVIEQCVGALSARGITLDIVPRELLAKSTEEW